MSNKYEVVPGLLWVGSELEDIRREKKKLMYEYLNGSSTAMLEIDKLSARERELLMPKRFRK